MVNLLKETSHVIEAYGKSTSDVLFVSLTNKSGKEGWFTWGEFSKLADFEYDRGYGRREINDSLKIVGEDFWLERHEYDGSEWWEFKTLPEIPSQRGIPAKDDLLYS